MIRQNHAIERDYYGIAEIDSQFYSSVFSIGVAVAFVSFLGASVI